MSAVDVSLAQESTTQISPLPIAGIPQTAFLKFFDSRGKRHSNPYATALKKRFGSKFNRAIDPNAISSAERAKWLLIFSEIQKVANRTIATDRKILFIDSGSTTQDIQLAKTYSEDFEKTGNIQKFGAWSIAVLGTAPRHGFANVPCAEFVAEVLRQSYERSGYKMADDFTGKNYLLWSNTAAVVNLARALHESGWIPWDPAEFKPPVGAIAMNALADSPGHTYLIAGENGRFLVDNGSPKGRDLFTTSEKIIGMMYDIGTFFLPPSIIPERW